MKLLMKSIYRRSNLKCEIVLFSVSPGLGDNVTQIVLYKGYGRVKSLLHFLFFWSLGYIGLVAEIKYRDNFHLRIFTNNSELYQINKKM